MSETVTMDTESCARCGEAHQGVEYSRISNPPEWVNWWASCPKTCEPMLMDYDPDRQQQTFAEICVEELEKCIGVAKSAANGLSRAASEKLAGAVTDADVGDIFAALDAAESEASMLRRGVNASADGG